MLQTFGELRLGRGRFRQLKPLLMLTYLAVEGPKTRQHLAELLWFDTDKPLANVAIALSRLNKVDRTMLRSGTKTIHTTVACDTQELLDALVKEDSARAFELYQGPFLHGLERGLGDELQEWIVETREVIAQRLQRAMLAHAARLADGQLGEAVTLVEKALQVGDQVGVPLEPDDLEKSYAILSRARHPKASDLQREATSFGIRLESLVLPPVSQQLSQPSLPQPSVPQLSVTQPSGTSVLPKTALPLPATNFVGREEDVRELCALLAQPDVRLVTLLGLGGMGKTRLALEVAHLPVVQGMFADGVVFVDLSGVTQSADVPVQIVSACGFVLAGTATPAQQLVRELQDKHLLLLLDNFEQLVQGSAWLSELLSACVHLKLLLTSRERLNIAEEVLLPVRGLEYPDSPHHTPEDIKAFDAVKLFLHRARRAHPSFQLDERDLTAIVKLCKGVEGSVLALELAAAWSRVMPIADIPLYLFEHLESSSRTLPKRHSSVRLAIDSSWTLLSTREQEVLRDLAVFVDGFDHRAAAAVTGATLGTLAALVDKSLLSTDANGYFYRHPLIYRYTSEKLEASDNSADVTHRHARYYINYLKELHRDKGETPEACRLVRQAIGNIEKAYIYRARQGEFGEVHDTSGDGLLFIFYILEGRIVQARDFYSELAGIIDALPISAEQQHVAGDLRIGLGLVLLALGRLQDAREALQAAHAIFRPLGSSLSLGGCLNALAALCLDAGDYASAIHYSEEARRTVQAKTNTPMYLEMTVKQVEGLVALGQFDAARHLLESATELAHQTKNDYALCNSFRFGSFLSLQRGDYAEATRQLEAALALAKTNNYFNQQLIIYHDFAYLHLESGDAVTAQARLTQAFGVLEQSPDKLKEATIHSLQAQIALAQADLGLAVRAAAESWRLACSFASERYMLTALFAKAGIAQIKGDSVEASRLAALVASHTATPANLKAKAHRLLESFNIDKQNLLANPPELAQMLNADV